MFSIDKGDWWCDLHRYDLLLQLIEALEKCMYNVYEGTVKFVFIRNKSTYCEWLNRIRIPIILTAVRNYKQYLMHACSLGQAENRKVPLLLDQKFAPVQHNVRALNSILVYSQSSFNNQMKYIIDN
ncbi:unnamed protein product [Rotaria sp. Silwood2]|nr:unnamed protein product [Rotaria sp. Silwood2]